MKNKTLLAVVKLFTILFLCSWSGTLGIMLPTTTERIHIDQFGYLPEGHKIAVISDPQSGYNASDSYTPGPSLEVRAVSTDNLVFTGSPQIWNSGNTHAQSGDKGWRFDFSSLTTPGSYYILDPTNDTKSYDFIIAHDVYNEVLKAAMKMFYYNRCNATKASPYAATKWTDGMNFNNPLQDTECSDVNDRENISKRKDLSGGWFDAGDYNKYVTFAYNVIHDLLSAYDDNPQVFGDDWGIPESGNGIPDILDEVKWEIDWLKKMQNLDGSVHIKMGSISHTENDASPPSANMDRRYYGPTCSAAEIAVAGMFAHASITFNTIAGLTTEAANLETLAELSWSQVVPKLTSGSLDVACDDGTIKAGDADWDSGSQKEEAITTAIYLFELTGKSTYNAYVINNITDAKPVFEDWIGPYTMSQNEALLKYTTLSNADQNTINEINASILPHIQGDWNNFFGQNDNDLYLSTMPDWSYHWGSNLVKAQYGNLNLLLEKYNVNPSQNVSYKIKAKNHVHYFHGLNPQSKVYLSNMYDFGADNSVDEMYHVWFADGSEYDHVFNSPKGPAPGYVVGGANKDFTISTISPPANQPPQKAYKEYNTGFPDNSWEITEPAIYYQSSYVRLLSAVVASNSVLPVVISSFSAVRKDEDVHLFWATESEINSEKVVVERRNSDAEWNKIAEYKAKGNTNEKTEYTHIDLNPWSIEENINYRIKFIDFDGHTTFSDIRKVGYTRSDIVLNHNNTHIFPVPAENILYIKVPDRAQTNIEIFQISGNKLPAVFKSDGNLSVEHLPSGIYIITFTTKFNKISKRFVKQ